jgi:hypothetical protein
MSKKYGQNVDAKKQLAQEPDAQKRMTKTEMPKPMSKEIDTDRVMKREDAQKQLCRKRRCPKSDYCNNHQMPEDTDARNRCQNRMPK